MAGAAASTSSRVREHKEQIPSSTSNIDRQYHHQQQQQHQDHHLLATQKQSQSTTKSSRLLSSSISTSVEPQQGSSSGSMSSSMNRRNKISQHHTRFTSAPSSSASLSHNNPMLSPPTATSVSDVHASNTSCAMPSLQMQDKPDIFHLHHIDQTHSTSSSTGTSSIANTQHMKSLQGQPQQQHYQMLRGRHKEDLIGADKTDYATSSFTNVDDLTNAIRNKVIVEEDEEDILSSDNTYLY